MLRPMTLGFEPQSLEPSSGPSLFAQVNLPSVAISSMYCSLTVCVEASAQGRMQDMDRYSVG